MSEQRVPSAGAVGLRHATDSEPGISRRRRGTGFSYQHPDGTPVSDEDRARIEALVIPPAWQEVWISPDPKGHIQATGRDEKGRKQYRYHEKWIEARNRDKFGMMVPFAEALPALRARAAQDLRRHGLPRDKVLALAVSLLDETLIRIGNRQYARANNSFGLTTLRDRHAAFEGSGASLIFRGKSGKDQALEITDRRLARLVKACRDIPGYTLFQFIDPDGSRRGIDSGMVNDYVEETTGERFTAKCFRTWGGTVCAAETLAEYGAAEDEREAKSAIVHTVREVAGKLGNTVATCRKYYIHPDIFVGYQEGELLDHLRRRNLGNTPEGLEPSEAAVLALLREKA